MSDRSASFATAAQDVRSSVYTTSTAELQRILVELPATLPAGTEERLSRTRISGQLIELREDRGRGGRPDKKPHRKGRRP